MACQTFSEHEWSEPQIVGSGYHPVRGPWVEWQEHCTQPGCERARTWKEFSRLINRELGRVGNVTSPTIGV